MERRAKLLGLDRPRRVDASMRVEAETVMDAEIRALIAQMRDASSRRLGNPREARRPYRWIDNQ